MDGMNERGLVMDEHRLNAIAEPLTEWFIKNRRELPWRAGRAPYPVWISEIMLQQTRIEAVIRYYQRFMAVLPDIPALAAVDDDVLMKLWEGLGYYSRARNLKKAAVMIMEEYGGVFPDTYEKIRKLPGVGDYTAGAIASQCFGIPVPAVDGNVLRVIARLTGSDENVLLPQTKKKVAASLSAHMPRRPGAFNEGLMELGERVCLPNGAPLCGSCPLREHCIAYRDGLTERLPVREKTMKRRVEEKSVFVIRSADGRVAVGRRGERGLLAGMYELPNTDGFYSEEELYRILRDWGLAPESVALLREAKHLFTHIEWRMKGYAVTVGRETEPFLWATEEELRAVYALPAAFQKFL
jgi:A/G-specific adenine glycosylase